MSDWRMGFVGGPLDGQTRVVPAVRHMDGWYPHEVYRCVDAKPLLGAGEPGSTVLTEERYERIAMGRPKYSAGHPMNELVRGYVYVHQSCLADLDAIEKRALELTAWGPVPLVRRQREELQT